MFAKGDSTSNIDDAPDDNGCSFSVALLKSTVQTLEHFVEGLGAHGSSPRSGLGAQPQLP